MGRGPSWRPPIRWACRRGWGVAGAGACRRHRTQQRRGCVCACVASVGPTTRRGVRGGGVRRTHQPSPSPRGVQHPSPPQCCFCVNAYGGGWRSGGGAWRYRWRQVWRVQFRLRPEGRWASCAGSGRRRDAPSPPTFAARTSHTVTKRRGIPVVDRTGRRGQSGDFFAQTSGRGGGKSANGGAESRHIVLGSIPGATTRVVASWHCLLPRPCYRPSSSSVGPLGTGAASAERTAGRAEDAGGRGRGRGPHAPPRLSPPSLPPSLPRSPLGGPLVASHTSRSGGSRAAGKATRLRARVLATPSARTAWASATPSARTGWA